MTLHHSKHHQTYITNLNAALKSQAQAQVSNNLALQLSLQPSISFNAGGHINHSLFWENLCPSSSASARVEKAPELVKGIEGVWGSVETFQEVFGKKLLGIQGSGWGWLVKDEGGSLSIVTTKDQDVVPAGTTPIFGVDM